MKTDAAIFGLLFIQSSGHAVHSPHNKAKHCFIFQIMTSHGYFVDADKRVAAPLTFVSKGPKLRLYNLNQQTQPKTFRDIKRKQYRLQSHRHQSPCRKPQI